MEGIFFILIEQRLQKPESLRVLEETGVNVKEVYVIAVLRLHRVNIGCSDRDE